MRDIIIYVARWWEKCLSKRSPLKHTYSWHDKLIVLWIQNRQAKISLCIFDLMITYYYINCCYLLFLLWLFHKINLFYYNLLCQSFDPYGLLLVSYIHRSVSVTKFLYVCQMWELQFFWTFSRCHKKIMIRSIMHVSVLILSHFYTEHRLFFMEDIFTSSWCSWWSLNFHVPFKYIFFQSILSSEVYVYHNRIALLSFWKCLFKQVKSSI